MLKIVVFDGGWGGELVANFIARELKVTEVIRVIDWHNAANYDKMTVDEIMELAEKHLRSYLNSVDLIVFGGFAVSRCLNSFRQKYPMQKFVGMKIDFEQILYGKIPPQNLVVLMESEQLREQICLDLREQLPYSSLILPDCNGWTELIDQNLLDYEVLRSELAWDFRISDRTSSSKASVKHPLVEGAANLAQLDYALSRSKTTGKRALVEAVRKFENEARERAEMEDEFVRSRSPGVASGDIRPDMVLLLNTHFWDIKSELERLFGWNVSVIDFRYSLLRRVCLALKLRGVDGHLSKRIKRS